MGEAPERFLIWVLMYVGGMGVAYVLVRAIRGALRGAGRGVERSRRGSRPVWATGMWHCATCRSTNVPGATRCASCRAPREELPHAAPAERADWIPDVIAVPPMTVPLLDHVSAAHADPSKAHWRMTCGGQLVGSAARRDGALALLRALSGTDVVMLDVRETGHARFRLGDAIARFERPGFPLDVACPEAGRG